MSADSTFGALEVDQQIVRMLGQMLQSEAVYSDPELVEQAGKLLDVVPDVQDEFLHQTPIEGGVLYRAVDVKFSKTLKKLGFNLAYESKHAGLVAVHVSCYTFFIYILNMIYVYYLSWLGVARQRTISFCKDASGYVAEYAYSYD